ncbi:MAG: glutamyl-tRNA reductase [Opitutaceae bacterium]|nr:glutamyl-tRNA reductase [Opitutaceae bacterium]
MSESKNSAPSFFVLGADHHTAPLETREKLALPPDRLDGFQQVVENLNGLRELAVLNTCNRIEFYGVADSPQVIDRLQEAFCAVCNLSTSQLAPIRHLATDREAVAHLMAVASGLESQMLGENEIFGQVKSAYQVAQIRHTAGPVLNRIFQKAFQGAKHIRTHTAITVGQVSVANVAVELATTIFGDLKSASVLLLGAGEIGEKTAIALRSRGVESLTVSSRTLSKAMELATRFSGAALPFETIPVHLHKFDIVVCSTSAPGAVITLFTATTALRRRPVHPILFIDLAMPRDIEPGVGKLENAYLYNLDDLARIAEGNRAARQAEVSKAKLIVEERAHAIWKLIDLSPPASSHLRPDATSAMAQRRALPELGNGASSS